MNAPDKIREIAIRGLIVNDEQTTKDELIQDVKRFIEHYQQKRKHFEDLGNLEKKILLRKSWSRQIT